MLVPFYYLHFTRSILPRSSFRFLENSPILFISYNLLLHTSTYAALILRNSYSDFVRSSYGESWDSSSVVKNHESQFKKQRVLN